MLFRWLSATNDGLESNGIPETSPICGWMIPNFLEESIVFYKVDGSPIGTTALVDKSTQLQKGNGETIYQLQKKVEWIPIPGSSTPPDGTPSTKGLNAHLMNVINFFKDHPANIASTLSALSNTVVLPLSLIHISEPTRPY